MSGQVPYYIREGYFVLSHGKPVKVLSYHFTANVDTPGLPNSDSLWVQLEGEKPRLFGDLRLSPITEGEKPSFIRVGRRVCVRGVKEPCKVTHIYYMTKSLEEARAPKSDSLIVTVKGFTPRQYEKGLFQKPLIATPKAS